MSEGVGVLLITANVGSLFEDPENLMQQWIQQILTKVTELQPLFVGLHLQEVGGKTYEKSMDCVQEFLKAVCEAETLRDFPNIRIFIDEDFQSAENFTALGNVYFGHKNLKDLRIWNFTTQQWETANDKSIFTGNIVDVVTKEKSKFPQHFFPECKWSRKGYMRTRWQIEGTVLDLVNIHLFHDASNLAACEGSPSVYCKTRRRALVHTLERFHLDEINGFVPFFMFGDFNFRCDTKEVVQELTKNLTMHRVDSLKTDGIKLHYRNSSGDNILTVGKKEFNHADHQLKFKEPWLKQHDLELEPLRAVLVEYPIAFAPSYPYEEDPEMPTDYMSTRCPAWCDRVVMSTNMVALIAENSNALDYGIIGENICMGDHKPVYLKVNLRLNQGTYRYCSCLPNTNNTRDGNGNDNNGISGDCSRRVVSSGDSENCAFATLRNITDALTLCNSIEYSSSNSDTAYNGTYSISSANNFYNSNLINNTEQKSEQVASDRIAYPVIQINIIDSNNDNVCTCKNNQCRTNPINPLSKVCMCKLSRGKQLNMANDDETMTNRPSMRYLNAFLPDLTQQQIYHQDPYTPESVESHSPLPEAYSLLTTATISIHSRISDEKLTDRRSPRDDLMSRNDTVLPKPKSDSDCIGGGDEKHQVNRGVVLPGQLISKLEDLQRANEIVQYADDSCLAENTKTDISAATVEPCYDTSCKYRLSGGVELDNPPPNISKAEVDTTACRLLTGVVNCTPQRSQSSSSCPRQCCSLL